MDAAAPRGHLEVARALLQARADINARTEEGWKSLHFAAVDGHEEVARVLVQAGADITAEDRDGRTPLDIATFNGHGAHSWRCCKRLPPRRLLPSRGAGRPRRFARSSARRARLSRRRS